MYFYKLSNIFLFIYFLKTINNKSLDFSIVIEEIQIFLEPVFKAIVSEDEWQKQWNHSTKWN